MDTPGLKGVTIFDILCLFFGVLLGFYLGIPKQCLFGYLKQQGVQYKHTRQWNDNKTNI